jgi:NAD(P)-dependent dehydrogenase (short-subunit alcohol dehydrogenase family)
LSGLQRTIVITGAANGIGAALSRLYAQSGANVALLDIDEVGVGEVAETCRQAGGAALPLNCDVTSIASCEAAIGAVLDAFERLDVLIANAGITHLSEFNETDLGVIRRVMEVNFFGAINITKAALPSLLENKGQIIAMSSVAGFCPLPLRTGYASSKYAVRGFFETLRTENVGNGLGVLVVCPSFVDTEIASKALGADGAPATWDRAEARGASPVADVAKKIFVAAEARKDFLAVARGAKLSYLLSRLSPQLLERLSIRRVYGDGKRF